MSGPDPSIAIPLVDLDGLAKACTDGDLSALTGNSALGWTLTEEARVALLARGFYDFVDE